MKDKRLRSNLPIEKNALSTISWTILVKAKVEWLKAKG